VSGWQGLVLAFLSYAWLLIPAPVIVNMPRRFFLLVVAASVVFHGGLVGYVHFAGEDLCRASGSGCPITFVVVPMFLLGVVLSVIAVIIRLVTMIFER
jgi:hypothetical protein